MATPLQIAIVVGEVSGDSLGVQLMRDLRARGIQAEFFGIGGPQMIAEGFNSLYPMERLAVMGLVEVMRHLKSLFAVRDGLIEQFRRQSPALFIGIDAPDFNLRVSSQIKQLQLPIPTVQYVSPSVWAWRQKRVLAMKQAVDLVLCLFPFEVEFYKQHGLAARFVGHPLASSIPLDSPAKIAQQRLGLATDQHYLAMLPGSRQGEVARLLPDLLSSAKRIHDLCPEIHVLVPAVNAARAEQIQSALDRFAEIHPASRRWLHLIGPDQANLPTSLNDSQASVAEMATVGRWCMQAADVVLLASGTATLEALLLHRPMVVVYRLHWLTYRIASRLVKIPYYSLPNILAGQELVSELIQQRFTPRAAAQAVLALWHTPEGAQQAQQLSQLHHQLADVTPGLAADVLIEQFGLS